MPAYEDLVFNACYSRLWDGLDWEVVGSGRSVGEYCIWRMERGLEPVHPEAIEAMRSEHKWAAEAPRRR